MKVYLFVVLSSDSHTPGLNPLQHRYNLIVVHICPYIYCDYTSLGRSPHVAVTTSSDAFSN